MQVDNKDEMTKHNHKACVVFKQLLGSRDGALVRVLAPHQCNSGFDSRTWRYHVG